MKKIVEKKHLEKSMNYKSYRRLIDELLGEGKTTGPDQSEQLTEYAKLNVARMKRIDKTIQILPEVKEIIASIQQPQMWIVLTEGWCGDAAQIVPVIYALAELNNKINLKLLLRDDNLELMDQYLTNGKSRSIPMLIAVNAETMEELFHWGARPDVLQKKLEDLKESNVDFEEIKELLHSWYAKDKTFTTQKEIGNLLARHV